MPSEDGKLVKKEEVEDDEDEKVLVGSVLEKRKKKPQTAPTPNPKGAKVKKEEAKPKVKKEAKNVVKKEEADEDFEEKPIAKKSSNKTDKIQKKKKVEGKGKGAKVVAEQNGKRREKKVYDLLGQKRDPPEERDPLRIFYETLYKQVPSSEMAAFWMMESGLLSKEVAKKVHEKKLKRSQQQKLGSPMKTVVSVKKRAESVTVKKKTVKKSAESVTVKQPCPVSTQKKKTPDPKVASMQSKKRKIEDGMSDDGSDDDFVLADRKTKKQRAA